MSAASIDLRYGGRPGTLSVWLSDGVLVDCGPSSCLPALLEGLAGRAPRALLLTHVHLDHAGAAGVLAERWPQLPIYVHPVGAPHLLDPTRLLASAGRVFGESLETLLGEVRPVPARNVRTLANGESVEGLLSAWTPGHASHHVAFLDPSSGLAFTGDLAGVRLAGGAVVPPTPPPDIDLRSWERSLEVLESWQPAALALAHFGRVESPRAHLALLRESLARHERWAAAGVEEFAAALHDRLSAQMTPPQVDDYEFVAMARQSPVGLRRWLERKDAAREPAARQ